MTRGFKFFPLKQSRDGTKRLLYLFNRIQIDDLYTKIVIESRNADRQTAATGDTGNNIGIPYYPAPTDASDIGGVYKVAYPLPSPNAESTIVQANTGTGDTLVGTFATRLGEPGVTALPAGSQIRRFYIKTGAAGQAGRLKVELYKRTSGGVETLLRSNYSLTFSGTTIQEITWTMSDPVGYTIDSTDRLVFKVYTARVSGPGTCTITIYFEGTDHASWIQTTLSTAGGEAVGTHKILDATVHTDSTTGTVVRGDIVTGQGATPKWTRLAKGTANQVLSMDGTGTDVLWDDVPAATPGGTDGQIQYNNGGVLGGFGLYDDAIESLAAGTDNVASGQDSFVWGEKLTVYGAQSNAFGGISGSQLELPNANTGYEIVDNFIVADDTTLGSEIVTNGTFTGSAAGWSLGSGWVYNSNAVDKNANGTATLSQAMATAGTIRNTIYLMVFTISNWTVGTVTPAVGTGTGVAVGSNGTHRQLINGLPGGSISFTPTNTARMTIDDVSVKEITGGDAYIGGNLYVAGLFTVDGTFDSVILSDPASGNTQTIATQALAASITFNLPIDNGVAGDLYATNGTGNHNWFNSGGCSIYTSSGTTLTLADTFYPVTFNSEEYDDYGWHSTVSNTSRVIPGYTGTHRFRVTAWVTYVTVADRVEGVTGIAVNGAAVKFARWKQSSAAGANLSVGLSAEIELTAATDYIECFARSSAAGTVTGTGATSTFLQVTRIPRGQ